MTTQEQIRERAYFLWEAEGHPVGREMDFWLRAEAEVLTPAPRPKAKTRAAATRKAPPKKAAPRKPAKRTRAKSS